MKLLKIPALPDIGEGFRSSRTISSTLSLALVLAAVFFSVSEASPDNAIQVVASSSFSNFERVNLKIDVPAYPMKGQIRFIKIFDDLNNTLFLGAVSPVEPFSVPVHALKAATKITVQLFSEDALDQPVVLSANLK